MTRRIAGAAHAVALAAALALAAGPARAVEPLGKDALEAILVGATLRGSMSDGTPVLEFYAEDGTLRSPDYTGTWAIEDGTLCLVRADPAAEACYRVAGNEEGIVLLKDGKIAGQGAVTKGDTTEAAADDD